MKRFGPFRIAQVGGTKAGPDVHKASVTVLSQDGGEFPSQSQFPCPALLADPDLGISEAVLGDLGS